MLTSQKLTIRQSEIRQKLNSYAGKDTLTDEERAEMSDKLVNEFKDVETRYRAALIAETSEAENRELEFGTDGTANLEFRALANRAWLGNYLSAARSQNQIAGAESEYNQALKIGASDGITVPWQMLETRAEFRAATTTANLDGGVDQRPILDRISGGGISPIRWGSEWIRSRRVKANGLCSSTVLHRRKPLNLALRRWRSLGPSQL